MSVEKSAPANAPLLQPRLQPRPSRASGFEDILAASVDKAQAGPLAPARFDALALTRNGATGVMGNIERSSRRSATTEVYGVVERRDLAGSGTSQTSGPASGPGTAHGSRVSHTSGHSRSSGPASQSNQFTPDEEATLRFWARAVNASPHPHVQHAKAPSLDDKPSMVAASMASTSGSPADIAASLIGRRYAVGGESPRQGFDCSGFTSYVFSKTGTELPRNSREQFHQGQPVDREHLRKGDLVFFGRKSVHHVGIYAGDGNFIHAATSAGQVHVSSLDDPIWSRLYAGARRVF